VRLTANGGQTYEWIPAAGLSSANIASPTASPDTSTTYTVIIREGSCIPDTATIRITVNPLSGVDAGPDVTVVAGTSTQLTATIRNPPATFTWSPDATLSCATCPDPEATPKNTTVYTVVARTDKGCVDSSSVQVKVICEQNQLFVPNTFTPNGDGENDRFYPRGRGIDRIRRFRIYDRWGALVFDRRDVEANDEATAWDGTINGLAAPPDVFVFIIEGTCDTGEEFAWQGDIALIK
jgi:gliding motility-associated-like protein